jgi:VCBS repeat-containing protein
LPNASDIDHGATLDATLISSPSGTYGSLTAFNTDTGAYTYTLNNGTNGVAGLVQSLAQGETVSDSFNYTVVDQFGGDQHFDPHHHDHGHQRRTGRWR